MATQLFRSFRYARRYENWREIVAALSKKGYPREAVLRTGERFEAPDDVNPPRAINGVYFKRCYSPPGFEIGPEDVVVDVGANIGVFTVYAASRTRGKVIAVEPSARNVEYLERNLAHNGCEGVVIEACALAESAGKGRLFLPGRGVLNRLVEEDGPHGDAPGVEVPTQTLEGLMKKHGLDRIDLLKFDCEGAEGLVLGTASEALLAKVRRIAMEFHDETSPLDHEELDALLVKNGYRTSLAWDGQSQNGFLYARR